MCNRQVRSNLWDFAWSLSASAKAGRMKQIFHSWPWLVDMLADVCRGSWIPDGELPDVLIGWRRVDTTIEPTTIRGVDFEMLSLREEAVEHGVAISPLRARDDFVAVMRFPELVAACNWVLLAEKTGVYTSAKQLQALVKRLTEKNLSDAALNERGLHELLERMRAKEGGEAPTALLRLGTLPATELGVGGPLPIAHGVHIEGEQRERRATIDDEAALGDGDGGDGDGDDGGNGAFGGDDDDDDGMGAAVEDGEGEGEGVEDAGEGVEDEGEVGAGGEAAAEEGEAGAAATGARRRPGETEAQHRRREKKRASAWTQARKDARNEARRRKNAASGKKGRFSALMRARAADAATGTDDA